MGANGHRDSQDVASASAGKNNSCWATPGNFMFFSALPLFGGAYLGYRRTILRADGEVMNRKKAVASSPKALPLSTRAVSAASKSGTMGAQRLSRSNESALLALRALSLGTFLSLGSFCVLSASVFFLTGSNSLEELIEKCRKWTPQKRVEVERLLGLKSSDRYKDDVDVIAVAGMSCEEEVDYYKRKYVSDLYVDEGKD